jgi:hypothetical protein
LAQGARQEVDQTTFLWKNAFPAIVAYPFGPHEMSTAIDLLGLFLGESVS